MKSEHTIEHYRYLNEISPPELTFFNHGFVPTDTILEQDFYNGIQKSLYHSLLEPLKTENKRILDIGCGRGGSVKMYNTYDYGFSHAEGVDISQDNIEFANKMFPGNTYHVMDAHNLIYPNSFFDIITNVESYHCYNDPRLFLLEVRRVLSPDGVFVLTDSNAEIEKHLHNKDCPFVFIDREDITSNVFNACVALGERMLTIEESPFRDSILYITEKAAFYYANRIWNYVKYTCYNEKSVFKDNK